MHFEGSTSPGKEGPGSSSAGFTRASHSWQARWIWVYEQESPTNSYFLFRAQFGVDGPAAGLRLLITAETRYRVLVNGVLVGEGPPPSQPHFQYYDVYDLAPHVSAGVNCIAVIVHYLGHEAGREQTRGGLLAEVVDDDGRVLTATGSDWRLMRATAWRTDTAYFRLNVFDPFQEIFDARQMPPGWDRAGYDDRAWDQPTVLRGHSGSDQPPTVRPWSALVARDIPFMAQKVLHPQQVAAADECLSLNRFRDDLSIDLSQPGRPLRYSRVEGAEALCRQGKEALVQNSTNHLDGVFDGIYDPCILLDFGRVVTAQIELELEGPAGGAVDVGLAERLVDGYFNNAVEGWFAGRYVMAEGRQTWRIFSWRGFRYARLRFRDCFAPVRVHAARAIQTTYPFEERGAFRSSDQTLNAIFDLCRYTLRLCSHESIMDTPWREQGQWLGDVAAVTLGGIYACFGETRLPAKFLRQSAATQLPHGLFPNMTNFPGRTASPLADYSLWWVMALWRHYLYTGEVAWIHDYYPHVLRIAQAFLDQIDAHGLVANMPHRVFVDWAHVDVRGESAVLNALLYGTLDVVADMARLKGDDHVLRRAQEVRTGIRANFVPRLYDPGRRCLADANLDGVLSPSVSEHANAAAILWGLCDEPLAQEIVGTLYETGEVPHVEAQPFFTTVVLQALDRMGRTDLALCVIRDRWGARMVARGATSAYEEWTINGSRRSGQFRGFMRTVSHAWSAHPAEFLICYLIGLEILEPGCRTTVRLRPRPVPFDYEVTFPTPRGEIRVTKRGDRIEHQLPTAIALG